MNIPNTFQTFNVYIDRAMELLTDAEFRCLMFATRHILGWRDKVNDRQGVISLTMFERGFETKAGAHFGGCGLSRGTIIEATNSLVTFGFLERIGHANMYGQRWQLSEGEIDWVKLETRKVERDAINQKRTIKATRASIKKREAGTSDVTSNVERTSAGTSDVTDAGTSDVLNQTHANTPSKRESSTPAPEPPKPTPAEVDGAIYDAPRTVRAPRQFPDYGPRAEQNPALTAHRSMQRTHAIYDAYAAQFKTPPPAPSRADLAAAWWAEDNGYTPAHIAKATAHRLKAGRGSSAFKFIIMDVHTLLQDSGPVLELVGAATQAKSEPEPVRMTRAEIDALIKQAQQEPKSA